eukprot:jgi/Botrbrau1/18546/Bobra.0870s0002.1
MRAATLRFHFIPGGKEWRGGGQGMLFMHAKQGGVPSRKSVECRSAAQDTPGCSSFPGGKVMFQGGNVQRWSAGLVGGAGIGFLVLLILLAWQATRYVRIPVDWGRTCTGHQFMLWSVTTNLCAAKAYERVQRTCSSHRLCLALGLDTACVCVSKAVMGICALEKEWKYWVWSEMSWVHVRAPLCVTSLRSLG